MIGKTVLVIAAEPATRRFVGLKIKEAGAKVLTAPSGKEGLIYAWRDRPDAIVIDPALPDLSGLDLARKLRLDRRTSHTPLIALADEAHPEAVLNGLEAGFNEYIPKSPTAIEDILRALRTHLAETSQAEGAAPPEPQTTVQPATLVVFSSAKGGVGTSSLCANMGALWKEVYPDEQVAVVDLVLPIGSLASISGAPEQPLNLISLSHQPPQELTSTYLLQHLPQPAEWNFHLVPGSPDPEASANLNIGALPALFNALRLAFDAVLVDIGRLISPRITNPLIQAAHQVVMVMNTDPSTVSITKTFLEYLLSQGLSTDRVFPIVNRTVGVQGMTRSQLEKELGLQLLAAIPYMHENFSLANTLHQPIAYKYPHYTATIALREATRELYRRAHEALVPAS